MFPNVPKNMRFINVITNDRKVKAVNISTSLQILKKKIFLFKDTGCNFAADDIRLYKSHIEF